ncbi:Shal, partial [Symbiodinium necroappetens]
YQQKNYNISWIAIARDDIRDMMGISVNRINNYMIVATLILSVAAGSIVSVSFSPDCPAFVCFAFYLSTSISVIYLMLSIMFGVKGQNSAFTNTMKLLTYQVRPENPAEYTHDYMKQAQWVERNGLAALFRIPGIMPFYNTDAQKDKLKSITEHMDDFAEREGGKGLKARGKKKKKQEHLGSPAHDPDDYDDDGERGDFGSSLADVQLRAQNLLPDDLVNLEEATPLELEAWGHLRSFYQSVYHLSLSLLPSCTSLTRSGTVSRCSLRASPVTE